MKLTKLIKGRLQQHRRGANPAVAISEGVDEIYFVFGWSERIPFGRPVNVFFRYMEVMMKVVVNCFSFYGCQTIVYLSTFIYHCKYFVFTSKVSSCKQGRFVCHLLVCCSVIELF